MKRWTLLFTLFSASACGSQDMSQVDSGTTPSECELSCNYEDADTLNFPASRCPIAGYSECLAECETRHPAGNWCPPP